MKKTLLFLALAVLIIGVAVLHVRTGKKVATLNVPTSTTPAAPIVATPKTLSIPAISVTANFESVAMDSQGRMDVPKLPADVGWYNLGAKPGEQGSAVVAGHLDDPSGAPAVFWDLSKLKEGNIINITDSNGKAYSFRVFKKASYPYNNFPLRQVFADTSGKYLNLITCAGTWDKNAKIYSNREVVFAVLQ